MSVARMLENKGPEIVTARESDSLQDVARVLAERKIGAVVVLNPSGKMSGIASERDIIRSLAQNGVGAFEGPIAGCMTRNVVSCSPDDTLREVMQMMTDGRFRHMPVLEDGELVGIISIGDVVSRRIAETEREKEEMQRYIAEGHA